RRHNSSDICGIASFGKIVLSLYHSFHRLGFLSGRPGQSFGSFGFLSGSVGRSYTNVGLFGLLGVTGAWPAGAGISAGFIDSGAGLRALCTDVAGLGRAFSGHCGPIMGFMFGGSGIFVICGAAWTACP